MVSAQQKAADVARDPNWLAHRYDPSDDKVHFIQADRRLRRKVAFLTDENLPSSAHPLVVDRNQAVQEISRQASLHFIFHSAYCCSTLLANALDINGVASSLKEPVILNDISGWRRRGGQPPEVADALKASLSLLAQPFEAREHVIIKPSNVVNALAPAMLATAQDARAVLLYTPLPNYLGSIARKGMWGRLWVRDLFVKLGKDGLTDYGFSADEILQQTDLQIAAIGWLAQHRLFQIMATRFGPTRVRTLEAEQLVAHPAATLTALALHYGLNVDADIMAGIGNSDVFRVDAKTGANFGSSARKEKHADNIDIHGDEIEKVVHWAHAVARSAGQSLDLPNHLI